MYIKHDTYRAQDRLWYACQPQYPTSGYDFADLPNSPTWHRRARRRRSVARSRIRSAIATGTAYKKIHKDLDLLEKHHSSPVYVKARKLVNTGMSDWIAPKQWWGRSSSSSGYYGDSYYSKGTGKGHFADKEQQSRKDRQRDKKKGQPAKGLAKGAPASEVEDKASATTMEEGGPSYAAMLKQNKMPEAKRKQAAHAIEEILAESAGDDRAKLLGHLRALIPESTSTSSAGDTSLKTKIHRVGNALGKATAKVEKQTEEIALKQRTWEKCSLAIREWASSQRKAFEKDIAEAKEILEKAQKEEKDAMVQLKLLQEKLEEQGAVEEDPYNAPMEEVEDETLFDTPPTVQMKDTGMTPRMKKLSLELQEANVEKEALKKQNQQMLEETQRLFWQIQQREKQTEQTAPEPKDVNVLSAEEVQARLDQDKLRRQKQLERARETVAKDMAREQRDRERSPKRDSQGSLHSLNSLT